MNIEAKTIYINDINSRLWKYVHSYPFSESKPYNELLNYLERNDKDLYEKLVAEENLVIKEDDLKKLSGYLKGLLIYLIDNPDLNSRKHWDFVFKRAIQKKQVNNLLEIEKAKIVGKETVLYNTVEHDKNIKWLNGLYEIIQYALANNEDLYTKVIGKNDPIAPFDGW